VLSGSFARRAPELAARVERALDEAILATRRDPVAARIAMARYLRPEERPFVDRYPPSRYLTSTEASEALREEIGSERALGSLDRAVKVTRFHRSEP
jgi:ABC-type nitrate/sulfonate/bicarbonate transport system substrate-binding protein